MNDSKRVAIITNNLVCEMNTKYYSSLEKYFTVNGWEVVADFNAEKIIFSTCGYSDEMYAIIRRVLLELQGRGFPEDNIVIMGCQPKTHLQELREVFQGRLLEFGQEEMLDQIINATVPFTQISGTNVFKAPGQECLGNRDELFTIQIEDGCLKQCTFCVINKAHGDLRSMPLVEIMDQFHMAIQNGYYNINLVGVDTFGYGYDTGTTNVVELMESMLAIEPSVKFYLGSLHARWLLKYWEGILVLCKRGAIDSLHIVIQHCNDEILKRMGRPFKFADIYGIITRFKNECPDLFISTDLIVGFPGETNEIFKELMQLVLNDRCFSMFNHFPYSDVKGAPASRLDNKVSANVIDARWKQLNGIVGGRSPYTVLSKRNDSKSRRFKDVYKMQNESGYNFCKGTYEVF